MTVAFVNFSRKWGGVKTWTLDFGGALQDRGHRVVVICRPGTPFAQACEGRGFRVYPVHSGPKFNPAAVLAVWRVLGCERAAVAVVNISKDLMAGALAARLRGIPVVHRVGLVEDFRGTLEERVQHRFLVDRILVPGDWMAEELPRAFSWIRSRDVAAIPNSKDLGRFARASGSGETVPVIGAASQLSASKGHACLLEAFARVAAGGTPARLRLAGVGPLEGELREACDRRGIAPIVEFAGFQKDMAGFLGRLDAFVLPSLKEGFPNALLEAMASGLPSVSSDIPGAREMLGDAGLLVPPGAPAPLAEALGRVAADAALRARLGAAARARAEARYDLAANVQRLEAFLRCAGRPSAAGVGSRRKGLRA